MDKSSGEKEEKWFLKTFVLTLLFSRLYQKFVSSTLHKASGLFSSQSRNLTELESTLALLGTLYRLLEISEQDAVSADTSAALARVLAHAQQLEILVWLAGVPDLPQFPANEIAETSRARRRALGDQSLLIDMWYQQFVFGSSGSAGAASAAVWPPSSLYHLLALLTPQVSEASTASGVPAAILQALMVYALLDASAFSGENRFGEKMVTSLASHLQISAKSVDRVRAVWSVDRNLDASAAAHVLAAVGFNIGQDDSQIAFAAVKRLVLANHPHAALVLLRFEREKSPIFFFFCLFVCFSQDLFLRLSIWSNWILQLQAIWLQMLFTRLFCCVAHFLMTFLVFWFC